MKAPALIFLASISGQAAAQYFVLYGQNTVVQRADPILYPGTIGQHVHEFAGSQSILPDSTYEQLRTGKCSSMGNAAGYSINEDRSSYWHPSLYVKALNGSYIRVPMTGRQIYYENVGSGTPRSPFEFPEGFRMVGGTNTQRAAAENTPTDLDNITQWICHAPTWNEGTAGGFPTGVESCSDYPYFNGAIHFPHCWNGADYDPSDSTAHMAYPDVDVQYGACPASHPIRLPHIFMENDFNIDALQGDFQANTFVLAQGDPTGFGWHADFYNGWKPGVLSDLLTGSNACYNHDVGDCVGVTFDQSTQVSTCTAEPYFVEEVNGPISAMIGCNPITTINPAPDNAPCALGVIGGKVVSAKSSSKTTTTSHSKIATSKATSATIKTASLSSTSVKSVLSSLLPTTMSKSTIPNVGATSPSTTSHSTTKKQSTTSRTSVIRSVVKTTITRTSADHAWTVTITIPDPVTVFKTVTKVNTKIKTVTESTAACTSAQTTFTSWRVVRRHQPDVQS